MEAFVSRAQHTVDAAVLVGEAVPAIGAPRSATRTACSRAADGGAVAVCALNGVVLEAVAHHCWTCFIWFS